LSWDDVGAAGYIVERATNNAGVPVLLLLLLLLLEVAVLQEQLLQMRHYPAETTYWYRIRSYNTEGAVNSVPSNIVFFITGATPPTGFNELLYQLHQLCGHGMAAQLLKQAITFIHQPVGELCPFHQMQLFGKKQIYNLTYNTFDI